MPAKGPARRWLFVTAVLGLMTVLCMELALSARQQSQTFDEAAHILAGVHYWHGGDFGINPEHPPLVKLVAALPLQGLRLQMPAVPDGYFKTVEYFSGQDFMRANENAQAALLRSRMALGVFMVLLALLVFAATAEMFGPGPGLVALLVVVFEPNLLAHGALVTTDVAVTYCLFLTVYAFYRYVRKPSVLRLAVVGAASGVTLAAKHSGLLIFPVLILLSCVEILQGSPAERKRIAVRLGGALLVVGVISFAVLWSFYGFRYRARPDGLAMMPDLATFAGQITSPTQAWAVKTMARWHLLPEAYLFGLADIIQTRGGTTAFLFGKIYPGGTWLYFPAVFVIKSTLGFLGLCLLLPVTRRIGRGEYEREATFLVAPAAFYLLVAMSSNLNLGVRHLLPVYPFLLALAGFGAWTLARRNRVWLGVIAVLLMFHVESSLRAFPNYLAYSNEIAGGPAGTYKVLSESNVDWGQGLKAMKRYVDEHHITHCWFAYFASLGVDPASYGIPCKLLPAGVTKALATEIIPPGIDGPVFVSATELSGNYWGPGELNPYEQFVKAHPDAEIADSIFAFNLPGGGGNFDVPLVSAVTHESRAALLAQSGSFEEALAEARMAAELAPNSVDAQVALGNTLIGVKRYAEARAAFERALALAEAVYPEYQRTWIAPLQMVLRGLPGA